MMEYTVRFNEAEQECLEGLTVQVEYLASPRSNHRVTHRLLRDGYIGQWGNAYRLTAKGHRVVADLMDKGFFSPRTDQ